FYTRGDRAGLTGARLAACSGPHRVGPPGIDPWHEWLAHGAFLAPPASGSRSGPASSSLPLLRAPVVPGGPLPGGALLARCDGGRALGGGNNESFRPARTRTTGPPRRTALVSSRDCRPLRRKPERTFPEPAGSLVSD